MPTGDHMDESSSRVSVSGLWPPSQMLPSPGCLQLMSQEWFYFEWLLQMQVSLILPLGLKSPKYLLCSPWRNLPRAIEHESKPRGVA